MKIIRIALIALLLNGTLALVTHAQGTAEIIRGRVIDDSSRALAGATVTITRGPDRLTQATLTDAEGKYSSRFEEGTGDYLIHVTLLDHREARRRVQRQATERELVADFTLALDITKLATVKVTASKPVRASNSASPYETETGAAEAWSNGVDGRTPPSMAGNLNAVMGTIPGITMTSGGPSMLGAASSSNLNTLNGLALPGGALPRAARVNTRVTGATFDPTRGGFAGANIDSRLSRGTRDYQQRDSYLTFDAPSLQATDQIGRSLGLINRGFRASLGADGEAIRRVLTYNVAVEAGRTLSDPSSLVSGDVDAWRRAGVAPDSIARVTQVAQRLGVPLLGTFGGGSRTRDLVTWLGRFDDVRDSLRTLTLTSYVSATREGAVGYGPLTAPAASGTQTDNAVGLSFAHSQFVGKLHNTLTQNRIGLTRARTASTPYVNVPGASVLVRSASDAAVSDVAMLQLGGNPWLALDDSKWTVEGSNESVWNARGSKHRFKTQAWFRGDGLTQQGQPNRLGLYNYNSLADFDANRPSSYSRTVTQPARHATTTNAAVAFAHQWNRSKAFNMLYGARLEGSAFGSAPPVNSVLDAALGVRSGVAPSRLHASPRLGFSYVYSHDRDNGNGSAGREYGTFYRNVMGYVRGGIGEFRDLYKPSTLADAIAGSGLAGSTLGLSCVGTAVPVPDWNALSSATAALPTSCADGGAALAERAPSVTLVDPSFDVPRSWRAALNWGSNIGPWVLKLDALGSYDLSQPSTLDANFAGVTRFKLGDEHDRPMFVSAAAIDARTGAVSARESRRSSEFGRVALRTSDLRGYGGQLTTTVMPDVFKMRRTRVSFVVSAAYTIQTIKAQVRGFDGATFGDPHVREWAPSAVDARHALVLQGGVSIPKVGAVSLFSRLQSGLPFTPLVQSDINGDGRANDRAYIPSASTTLDANQATTDAQLRALIAAAPPSVGACLERQRGTVAARNSCRGSWTQSLNMQWTPRIPIKVRGQRLATNVVFENPLSGLDQLLHGANGLRGWGTQAAPDPVLLVPRSFDAATQRFRYDVNPRFGDTRAFRTLSRTPFRVTLDFKLDLAVPFDVQALRRAVEPVKTPRGWERRGADSIAAIYLRRTSNLHAMLLAESDSIFLTKGQIAALVTADSVFAAKVRALYVSLGEFLKTQPSRVGKVALDSVESATKRYWPMLWEAVDQANTIVTPQQRQLMPLLRDITLVSADERKKAQWYFGYDVPLVHKRSKIGYN